VSDVKSQVRRAVAGPTRKAWRAVRKVLPARFADPLEAGAKRGLRKAGLLGAPSAIAMSPIPPSTPTPPANVESFTDPAECPVCGTIAAGFKPFGLVRSQPERQCPSCGSLERHRGVWLYFQERTNLFTEPVHMLHIAPEMFLARRLGARDNIDYLTADLDPDRAMVTMDITDIQYPDDTFDVVFASHVLEHIPDDELAMRELRRVLRPGGWAILQVPIYGPKTREDPSVVDPAERERLFGQDDHVRMYGNDGEYERRLTRSGFDVKVDRFVADMAPAKARRYRLSQIEDIYFCTKAGQ
jgi:SAM-dependent methyltransferase